MSTQYGGEPRRPSVIKATPAGSKPDPDGEAGSEVTDKTPIPRAVEADSDSDVAAADLAADAAQDAAEEAEASPEADQAEASHAKSAGAADDSSGMVPITRTRTAARPRPAGTPNRTGKTQVRPGRRGAAPVPVARGRNWTNIGMFGLAAVVALGIVGYAAWAVYENSLSWQKRADQIDGIVNFNKKNPSVLEYKQAEYGPLKYTVTPPVGGPHNPNYMRCQGDVYDEPVANEHAVASENLGAVWITYNPDKVSKKDIETLQKKVVGKEYMLMSPYPGQDSPISLQTWGYQLKVKKASDGRIDDFIKQLRQNATKDSATNCVSGKDYITEPGTTPRDLGKDGEPAGGAPAGAGG